MDIGWFRIDAGAFGGKAGSRVESSELRFEPRLHGCAEWKTTVVDMCISCLQWGSVSFGVPRKPREESRVVVDRFEAKDFRLGGLVSGVPEQGGAAPDLGLGTGTPFGVPVPQRGISLIRHCVPVPIVGYRYTKQQSWPEPSLVHCLRGLLVITLDGYFWMVVQCSFTVYSTPLPLLCARVIQETREERKRNQVKGEVEEDLEVVQVLELGGCELRV